MSRLVALALVLTTLAACKQGTGASRPHRPGGRDRGGTTTPPDKFDDNAKAELPPAAPCGGVGTPWDGKPEGCTYEHDGCCYADAETACKAAACAAEHCTVLETYPAQIACDVPDAG